MLLLKKLRWKSIFDSSFKTYLKYAIGEIILIVIGVLIAVSINRCTTEQNNIEARNKILNKILDDFKKDQELAGTIKARYAENEPIFASFMNETITLDSLQNCKECRYIISGISLFRPNLEGFNALKTQSQNLIITDGALSSFVNSYDIKLKELDHQQDNLIQDLNKNLEYWRDNFEWFTDFLKNKDNDSYFKYQLSSDYRNKLGYYHSLYYHNYLVKLEELMELQEEFETIVKELRN